MKKIKEISECVSCSYKRDNFCSICWKKVYSGLDNKNKTEKEKRGDKNE